MPKDPIKNGLVISLELGEQLPCQCCYEVEARTSCVLPETPNVEPIISSLVAHLGCQIALLVKSLAPDMPDDVLGEFLGENLKNGLILAMHNGKGNLHA